MADIRRFRRATPVDLTVAARPASVVRIRRALVAYAASLGAGDELQAAVALAASEAAGNAVVHAYVGGAPGEVHIVADRRDGALIITISDQGRGMVPRTDSPGLGLGLALMAHLADSCEVHEPANGEGTRVTLRFDLEPADASAPPFTPQGTAGRPSSVRPDLGARAAGPSVE
jgi:anti-sigma regulatory factor (Ser/Thr protein kinase)